MRTENKQTDREQTENSKPEATLIPVDSQGERANQKIVKVEKWDFRKVQN